MTTADKTTFVGLDLSLNEAVAFALASDGQTVGEWRTPADAGMIAAELRKRGLERSKVGLETGVVSNVIHRELRSNGIDAVCLDARHAHRTLSLRHSKTDRNDAHGLAELMRSGWYREVRKRDDELHMVRSIICARRSFDKTRLDTLNSIRGYLHSLGLYRKGTAGKNFIERARNAVRDAGPYKPLLEPMVELVDHLAEQIRYYDIVLDSYARSNELIKRLEGVPGVGRLSALAFASSISDTSSFRSASNAAAFLGLAPRTSQSGEARRTVGLYFTGETHTRTIMYMAAQSLIVNVKKDSALKRWADSIRERMPLRKACIAVARKLAIIMFTMMRSGSRFVPEPS